MENFASMSFSFAAFLVENSSPVVFEDIAVLVARDEAGLSVAVQLQPPISIGDGSCLGRAAACSVGVGVCWVLAVMPGGQEGPARSPSIPRPASALLTQAATPPSLARLGFLRV